MSDPAIPFYISASEGHEERLLRLESSVQEVSVRVAEVAIKQDHVSEQLEGFRSDVTDRMTAGFASVQANSERILGQLEDHRSAINAVDARLKPLEASRKASGARKQLLRKAAVAALLAAAGAFAAQGGEWLWGLFGG